MVQTRSQQDRDLVPSDHRKDKQEIDTLLSQAMSNLTFEEREKHQEMVHGVDQVVENPAFVDGALQELEYHLSCTKPGTTYD